MSSQINDLLGIKQLRYKSVLITGTDLSGKTSLQSNLAAVFRERGINTICNKNDLSKSEIMQEALMALDDKRYVAANALFMAAYQVDANEYTFPEDALVLQDSYFYRTIAYCEAYDYPHVPELLRKMSGDLLQFDLCIYLKASLPARRKRMLSSGRSDRKIDNDPDRFLKMDRILEKEIMNIKNHLIINTEDLSSKDVVDLVLPQIYREEYSKFQIQ